MKKFLMIFTIVAAFAACKAKPTETKTDKDLLILTDPASKGGSYLTDTGAVANTPTRGAEPVTATPVPERSAVAPKPAKATSGTQSNTNNSNNSNTGNSNTTATAPATTQKKGWSKSAKGATIGAVGGAVTGAVIGKNAKGAVIGGVLGAAGGYIIGRSKDKKDGRVQ